jgi:tRNA(Arg) A34 adenosine deaminase TadA
MATEEIRIVLPAWVDETFDRTAVYDGDEARMRVAVEAARQNVLRDAGGPFAAAVFERYSGRLVAVGVNLVVPMRNSALHGEVVAYMVAQQRVGAFSLSADGVERELFSSCEPCAMCLGATLWSGISRVVWAATREDACELGFEEGPVFPESYDYVRARGVRYEGPVLRAEGRAVLELYLRGGGPIYNG